MTEKAQRLFLSGPSRAFRPARALTLCLALLLIGGSVFSLVHCYGNHAHGRDMGRCAICAFACHAAAALLSIATFTGFALVCRFQPFFPDLTDLLSGCSPYLIRAPPVLL